MLSEPEQAVFRQLSLFKGGFQREAARAVARAGLPILVSLVDKSLLRLTPSGRYQVHEVLRQFAAEKLLVEADRVETPDRRQPESALVAWQRYSAYYLSLVNQREASLRGSTPQPALSELWADLDNIRQAWQWAVIAAQIEEIEGAMGGLARFYDLTSLFQEGAAVFDQAANDLQAHVGSSDEGSKQALQRTMVKLWVEQARLLNRRGLSEQALQIIPRRLSWPIRFKTPPWRPWPIINGERPFPFTASLPSLKRVWRRRCVWLGLPGWGPSRPKPCAIWASPEGSGRYRHSFKIVPGVAGLLSPP